MALTPAGDIKESPVLVGLNNPPVSIPTAGEGAAAMVMHADDIIASSTSAVLSSVYTLGPRIPTNAKIKKVSIYAKNFDTNATSAGAADINLIFSDAPVGGFPSAGQGTNDGTSPSLAGLIPTSALTGAVTTIASYTSPNKMFGSAYVLNANSGASKLTDVTYNNIFTYAMTFQPLWQALGFTQDPGGFLNFFLVVTTAPSTAGTGTIGLIVDYAV